MSIKGIIFDLDGVITDTAEFHYLAWKNLGEKIEIKITREFNEKLKGVSRRESLEKILLEGNKGEFYNDKEKEELANMKNDYYLSLLQRLGPEAVLSNIKETLEFLRERKIKVIVASASKNAPFILEKLTLVKYIDIVVNPESIKNGKPAPDIFLEGAKLAGLDSKECIGIEDSEAGIISINKAGMISIGIGDSDVLKNAKIVIKDTKTLKETIIKVMKEKINIVKI